MQFDQLNLHPIIARNLSLMQFSEVRPIQAQAIPHAIDGRDVIGLARTGTGKTAAFIVPIAHRLISEKPLRAGTHKAIDSPARLRAIIITPTRELAQQVADEARHIVQGSVLRVAVAYGKVAISPQAEALARGVDLLVVTPGRARELLEAEHLSLSHVKHVVIDEADRMLDMGFLPQVQTILQAVPNQRQMLLFTATMPGEVETLAREFLREPVRVESEPHSTPAEHVQQHLLPVSDDDKVALLLHFIRTRHKRGVLVFCRTKRRVGWVGTALQRNEIEAGMLHGDMSQAQRTKSLNRFVEKELAVLVATDVAARGLHIPAVKTVVNYDLPLTPEEYVHRIGRAGHGGGFGESFTLLSDDLEERARWRAVLNKLGVEVFAEELEGFTPTKPIGRAEHSQKSKSRREKRAPRTMRGKTKKSRKSRPIKPGQKPGKGVMRKSGG